MITIELNASVALGWADNPHFDWTCPLCGSEFQDEPSESVAALNAVYHLVQSHRVDWDEIRVSFEYWLLSRVRGLDFKKVEKK